MAVVESSQLGGGTPNVHQYGELAKVSASVAGGSTVFEGDLVYLSGGVIATLSGASAQGASFLGVANGTSPTQDMYGNTRTPNVVVLVGGVALLAATSATYSIGQAVYIKSTGGNVVASSANGTSIGTITSPPGVSDQYNYYSVARSSVYVQLAHPGFTL
jgi:hypothetical protein